MINIVFNIFDLKPFYSHLEDVLFCLDHITIFTDVKIILVKKQVTTQPRYVKNVSKILEIYDLMSFQLWKIH